MLATLLLLWRDRPLENRSWGGCSESKGLRFTVYGMGITPLLLYEVLRSIYYDGGCRRRRRRDICLARWYDTSHKQTYVEDR